MTNNFHQKYRSSYSSIVANNSRRNTSPNAAISASFNAYLKPSSYAPSACSSSPFSISRDDTISRHSQFSHDNHSHTPVCSDNDDEATDDEQLDIYSDIESLPKSASPGYKKWYMAFPSNNNNNNESHYNQRIKHKQSSHHQATTGDAELLSTFNIGTDFCVENLQPQQTDIFCSAAYDKNSSSANPNALQQQAQSAQNEGVHHSNHHESSSSVFMRDGDGITMMGCIAESNHSLKFNFDIPAKWQSKIYSEGNIVLNRSNDTESQFEPEIIHEEGTNDTQMTQTDAEPLCVDDDEEEEEEVDEDEDDDLLQSKGYTLMGPIHTNDECHVYDNELEQKDEEEEEEEDEDDDLLQSKGVTLMGQLDLSQKIAFGMQSSVKDTDVSEIGTNQQHLPFSHCKGIVMMNGRDNKMIVFNASAHDENDKDGKTTTMK